MNTFKENMLEYLSFTLVLLMPVIFWSRGLFPHISSKTFFMYGVVEILFFLWLYVAFKDRQYRLSKKTLLMFAIPSVVLTWMTLATIYAVNPNLAFWSSLGRGTGLLTFYHVFAFALVTASLVKKSGMTYVTSLFQYFIAGSSLLALSVWMGVDGFHLPFTVLKTDAGGGFAGNSTLAAGYFLFTLAVSLFLLCSKNISKTKKLFIYSTMAIIIFSPVFASLYRLFSDGSILGTARGTILAIISGIGASVVGYMFLSSKKSIRGLSVGIATIAVLVSGFLWVQLVTPNTTLHNKFAEQARGSRFIFWDVAQKAIDKNPVLGYGPENYQIAFQENFNPKILRVENSYEGWADRAHNQYYDLGVSGGYPLIILYALFLGSLFYVLLHLHKKGVLTKIQVSIFVGLLVAYIVNNLMTFDSNLSLTALFMITGILYSLYGDDGQTVPLKKRYTDSEYDVFLVGFLGLACVACLIFFVKMPVSKSGAYAEIFVMPINKRAEAYKDLLSGSSVGEAWDVGGLADDLYKKYSANPAQFKNDTKLLPYVVEDLTGLINYLEEVSVRNPTDYRLSITIAHLYGTLLYLNEMSANPEMFDHVLMVLNKAKKLSPTNPNVHWSMAQIYVWKGDLKSAENAYKEGIAIDPTFASSHRLLVQFAEIIGDQKLYTEALAQAQKDIPDFKLK